MLKGLIDAEKEVSKLKTKQGEVQKQIAKFREKMSKADYSTKVPQKTQNMEVEKVTRLKESKMELQKVEEAMRKSEKMI
ncbi:valine--tRNA ligase-like [Mobula hypostoma]|uniref:valine--tRNA ligase-like n=1 Tax=Mobula hypostoma TaxID=723540 RepID=UPI002FC3250E